MAVYLDISGHICTSEFEKSLKLTFRLFETTGIKNIIANCLLAIHKPNFRCNQRQLSFAKRFLSPFSLKKQNNEGKKEKRLHPPSSPNCPRTKVNRIVPRILEFAWQGIGRIVPELSLAKHPSHAAECRALKLKIPRKERNWRSERLCLENSQRREKRKGEKWQRILSSTSFPLGRQATCDSTWKNK